MKQINLSIGLLLLLVSASYSQQEDIAMQKIEIDGIEREYILYVPDNLPANAPMLMVFHGYSGTAAYAHSYFNLQKQADEHGFVVVYPQGTKDQLNNHFWQVGYKSHRNIKINDVSFVTKLAKNLQDTYKLNKANTFIVGFSNGGDLCNKLICEQPNLFKASAPIISCMMKEMYDACTSVEGKPTFLLNGTKDNVTFWAGDMEDKQGYGPYHSTESMLALRIKQNKVALSSTNTISPSNSEDNTSITIKKYKNEINTNQVWMYQVNNGGHGHPEYLNLQQHVWDFFSLYVEE